MAGNLLQVGSDGKLRVKSNGLVVAGASDPCCCTPVDCLFCGTQVPTVVRVILYGTTLCVGNNPHGTYDVTIGTRYESPFAICFGTLDTGVDAGSGFGNYILQVGVWGVGTQPAAGATIFMYGANLSSSRAFEYTVAGSPCRSFFDAQTYANQVTTCSSLAYNGSVDVSIISG